jgi:2-amino-4-hydroxy-6-hydroxymethyldihydropteridine diphosphokinase
VSVHAPDLALPSWARVADKRRAHIERVVRLLEQWAASMQLDPDETSRWRAAGLLHDALRDATEALLRTVTGDTVRAAELLHGPAAAIKAEQDGERRQDVLDAVRYHTLGWARWIRTGRALYLADFLEPGRKFLVRERAAIAAQVPRDFDVAFRDCVRLRIQYALSRGGELFPESVELWNAVR